MKKTMIAKSSMLMISLLVMVLGLFAQTKTVTGKVTDNTGAPVERASVTAKGSSKGVFTAADGTFSITVPEGTKTLTISSASFVSQDVSVDGTSAVSVSMVASTGDLTGVVVVGYGTRKVKDATGSVASITAKDFNKGQISTPEQLFQGRTPGVTVTPASGEPGAAATINIRGTSSIRGDQPPLYIVDGVPLDGGGTTGSSTGTEGGTTPKNPLMFINPNDIESISILKDASSAAIYGARGANGVIIITTKNGKGKAGSWNFGMTTSINSAASRYNLLNRDEFLRGAYTMSVLEGTDPALAEVNVRALDFGGNTDWQDEIFRTSVSQNYNLSYGFARNKMALRASGSFDNQQGIVRNSSLKRLTARVNFSQTFLKNDALRLEVSTNFSNLKNQYVPNTNNAGYQGSLIGAALRINPTLPVRDPSTGKYSGTGDQRNPVAMLDYIDDRDNVNRSLSNLSLSYRIIEGLTFKTTVGYDYSKGVRTGYVDPRLQNQGDNQTRVFGVGYGNGTEGNGRAAVTNDISKNLLLENTLTYNKIFNGKHDLNVVLGTAYQKAEFESNGTVYWNLATPVSGAFDVFNKSVNSFTKSWYLRIPTVTQNELNSYFGRVNYSFDDRYLLTGTLRADGSSKFGKNNRYGIFPAVGARWKIMNESFAAALKNVFSDFSLRGNWGIIGSQDGLGSYSAVTIRERWITSGVGVTPEVFQTGAPLHQANDDLKWEEAATTSIALDFASKNRRISGTVEYFNTNRKNMIFFGPTPGGFGASSNYFQNLPGTVNNQGVEVSLNLQAVKSRKFNWDISYNMSFLKNVITGLPSTVQIFTGGVNGPGLTGAFAQRIANGLPLFSWYMQTFTGYDNAGKPTYEKDASGAAIVGNVGKSALPTFTAGLTNNFTFGRFNASIFLNAVGGFYVYNNTANGHFLAGILKNGGNVTKDVISSGENPLAPGSPSTKYLEKGDFIRLSNALIGYEFQIKNKYIKTLNASISGQNLLLFTNYTGLDPEVNVDKNINGVTSRGFDYAGYPKARTISISLNVGF